MTSTTRTLADRCAAIRRMINSLSKDTAEWEPSDLHYLIELEEGVITARTRIVHGLRDQGYTDRQIGMVLGISQQAVSKRWPGGGRYVGAAGRYRTGTPSA